MLQNRLFTKSEAAFRLSFRKLQEENRKLYFWTFTAEHVETDRRFASAFHLFWDGRLRNRLPADFAALRVFQHHEGDGERSGLLHAHMVCNARLPVTELRRLAYGTGIGQVMDVRRAKRGLEDYLCRYMARDGGLFGIRTWAKLGYWEHCRKTDIEVHSRDADFFRAVMRLTGDWAQTRLICFRFSEWARSSGEISFKTLREKILENPEWADLHDAVAGWPVFLNGEIVV